MTWVLYNAIEIVLEENEASIDEWIQQGYTLHGSSSDEAVINAYVDELATIK